MKQNDSVCWSRWNEQLNSEGGRSNLKEREEDKVWSIGYVCMRACVRREERGAAMIYDSRLGKRDGNDQTI